MVEIENETRVLNSFIDKSSTNIQYLNDLSEQINWVNEEQ